MPFLEEAIWYAFIAGDLRVAVRYTKRQRQWWPTTVAHNSKPTQPDRLDKALNISPDRAKWMAADRTFVLFNTSNEQAYRVPALPLAPGSTIIVDPGATSERTLTLVPNLVVKLRKLAGSKEDWWYEALYRDLTT